MDLWSVLKDRIKQHGVRVEERLELLAALKSDHENGEMSVENRKDALLLRLDATAASLKDAMRG